LRERGKINIRRIIKRKIKYFVFFSSTERERERERGRPTKERKR